MGSTDPEIAISTGTRLEIAKDGLQIALQILGLSDEPHSSYHDPVLIAIDIEGISAIGKVSTRELNTQVGLAILDITNVITLPRKRTVSTYNFVTGSREYYHKAQLRFLFGKPTHILIQDMFTNIQRCIPQNRNIILVGHDVRHEISGLSKHKMNFQKLSILDLLDTFRMAV